MLKWSCIFYRKSFDEKEKKVAKNFPRTSAVQLKQSGFVLRFLMIFKKLQHTSHVLTNLIFEAAAKLIIWV